MNKSVPPANQEGRKSITLKDVAIALGVSKSTVSMALSGNELVAEKTRVAVLKKAQELGYVYNRGAASLSTGVTGLVGLAVHNITNPYFTRVCAAIEDQLERSGKFALLCNLDESLDKQSRFLRALLEQKADGLIICPAVGTTAEDLSVFDDTGPTVLFAREVPGNRLDFVGNDDKLAMSMATQHLLDMGHKRIGLIYGGGRTSVSRLRRDGYISALEAAGLECNSELLIEASILPEGGEEGVERLMALSEPPSAIVCFTDYIALGAISTLHRMGLIVGKDIAVIGCDGIPEGERSYINLSTINVQKQLLGQTAAKLLLARLDNPDKARETIKIPPIALFRSSCGEKEKVNN